MPEAAIKTVDSSADCEVTITSSLVHRCPYRDELDVGLVTIVYQIDGSTIELHSLRSWLDSFRDSIISHEALTDAIRHELSIVPGLDLLSVSTTWHTAGMEVSCSTSPTPADPP